LRLLGRGSHYYEKHRSYLSLRRLVREFQVHDYTLRLIREPQHFGMEYLLRPGSLKQWLAQWLAGWAPALVPTYIWLLEKPE
jgi:hypothetical protein